VPFRHQAGRRRIELVAQPLGHLLESLSRRFRHPGPLGHDLGDRENGYSRRRNPSIR
jgi:hypothetical protein